MPRVFKRFERTDRIGGDVFDGVGLGLAIAKALVEAQDGTLTIGSQPGEGSVFSVTLPQATVPRKPSPTHS